ncbi:MAG: VPDSG-CTERM sorting domain-containing protein [Pedosphaera sp.]|nr:VPDSG-CTERM sorting domain-containing protein [Pedosphaera sp.]
MYKVEIGVGDGATDFSYTQPNLIEFGNGYVATWAFNSGSILADAQNGTLGYKVSAPNVSGVENDFTFKSAKVEVTSADPVGGNNTSPSSVPDGGATAALLGLGMLGLAGLRRKLA